MWRKARTCALLVGLQAGAATRETSKEAPQETENRTSLSPSNPSSGYMPKGYT